MSRKVCDKCKEAVNVCLDCKREFLVGEEIICFAGVHFCAGCYEEKEPNAKIEIMD